MSTFCYQPLAQDKKQIRILTVKPGVWNARLECELKAANIGEGVSYEALSYVWGDTTPRRRILLNGADHDVGPNLESALRHLRFEDLPRVLWVDAVCINQDDLAERKAQVLMMADIYKKAKTTLSWLGEAADESDDAIELICKFGDWTREHEREIFDGSEPPDDGSIQTITDYIEWLGLPLRNQNWSALWQFLERPYWSRVWIIQELAVRGYLANASGILQCGTRRAERSQFDYFSTLILMIILSGHNVRPDTQEIDEPLKSMLVSGHPPGLTMAQTLGACNGNANKNLDWLLRVTGRFKATNPRDKVYSLLGLAEDGSMLEPDYAISFEQLLKNFVTSHVTKYKSLRTLLGNRYREIASGPSWIPDVLNTDFHGGQGLIPAMDNDFFQASGSTIAAVSTEETSDLLSCHGIYVGEIEKAIGPLCVAEKHVDPSEQNIQRISHPVQQDKFFESLGNFSKSLPESSKESFWRTMCLDADWSGQDPVFPAPTNFALKQQVAFGFEAIPPDFMPRQPESARYPLFVQPFVASLQSALSNRTFITTTNGRMGVGPYLAQAGDIVTIMFGAPFCLVLRPIDDRYKLVGDAYIHGIMRGELVEASDKTDKQMFEII